MMARCNGKTKNNQRCKRKVNTSKYCFTHNTVHNDNKNTIECEKQTIDCPVCMELIDKIYDTELDCNHPICIECAKKLYDNKCPICRTQLSSKKLHTQDIKIIEERRQLETINRNQELLNEFLDEQPRRIVQQPITINNNLLSLSQHNVIRLDRFNMTLIII